MDQTSTPAPGPEPSREELERRLAQLRAVEGATDGRHALDLARTLAMLAWEYSVADLRTAEAMATEALALATPLGETAIEAIPHLVLAFVQRAKGSFDNAVEHAEAARVRFAAIEDHRGVAGALGVLSSVHDTLGDISRAMELAHQSVKEARLSEDRLAQAWALHALATAQASMEDFDSALANLDIAQAHFEAMGSVNGLARCHASRAYAQTDLGRPDEARRSFLAARPLFEENGSMRGLAATDRNLAELALADVPASTGEALERALSSIRIAGDHEIADIRLDALILAARAYLASGDLDQAIAAAEEALALARSGRPGPAEMRALEVLAAVAAESGNYARAHALLLERLACDRAWQVSQKPIRMRDLELGQKAAEAEATDRLLHTVLPAPVVQELKLHGAVRPRRVEGATVLFTDLVGFTDIASRMAPEALVEELEKLFGALDEVVRQHGLERLKTIGDAYMAVAGVPIPDPLHVPKAVLAALGFRDAVARIAGEAAGTGKGPAWQLRIGLHAGPLVAGMIGRDRTAFDVWGDTVNVASRMESNGQPGRVNVSEEVYRAIAPWFVCEARGSLPVKNRGTLEMWFVERLRPEWSADADGLVPNPEFWGALRAGG